jgi:membrane protein DedA with SNARE-associated domain
MVSRIIDALAKVVVATIALLGYPGVFLLMFVESCGIPMPSEVIMPFAGFVVVDRGLGWLGFAVMTLMGALGNLGGSLLAYWIGAKGGRPLIERYGRYLLVSRHDLNMADRWFTKYGEATAFFSRLMPIVRTYISFPAGVARMNVWRFSVYTFVGAVPWCAALTYAGMVMGRNWELIREKLHSFDLAVGVLVLLGIGLYLWRHFKHAHEGETAATETSAGTANGAPD